MKGMSPKRPPPVRSKVHRLWVKSLACSVAGCMQAPEGHHIRTGFYTLARRPGDDWLVPLCREHHEELHHGAATFERKHKLDLQRVAKVLWGLSPGNPINEGMPRGWR